MKNCRLDISTIALHQQAAQHLIEFAGTETLFLFDAPMGSGKTMFQFLQTQLNAVLLVDARLSLKYLIDNFSLLFSVYL